MVNGVLLRPLPYPHAERLVDLSHSLAVAGLTRVDQSDATYLLYRQANRVFTDIGIYRATSVDVACGRRSGGRRECPTARIRRAGHARPLSHPRRRDHPGARARQPDGAPDAPPVAVISQGLWKDAFGSDPAIVGRRVAIAGVEHEIVGVAGPDFHFPGDRTELWLPLRIDPTHTKSAAFDYQGIGRLRDGVTTAAATADLQRLLPQVPVVYPDD